MLHVISPLETRLEHNLISSSFPLMFKLGIAVLFTIYRLKVAGVSALAAEKSVSRKCLEQTYEVEDGTKFSHLM